MKRFLDTRWQVILVGVLGILVCPSVARFLMGVNLAEIPVWLTGAYLAGFCLVVLATFLSLVFIFVGMIAGPAPRQAAPSPEELPG